MERSVLQDRSPSSLPDFAFSLHPGCRDPKSSNPRRSAGTKTGPGAFGRPKGRRRPNSVLHRLCQSGCWRATQSTMSVSAAAPRLHRFNVVDLKPSPAQRLPIDRATAAGAAVLAILLAVGLVTAADYGATIDEFNANDYGAKALAWYTSGFTDRSQFETVESALWYYGPWFQMLTAAVQSLGLAGVLTVRHAMTFLAGLAGLGALLPMARLSFGAWVGPLAIVLCALTGYVYGDLFFAPIDVPFLAAMGWATLAIMLMARTAIPTWPATVGAGIATGLAIATRTGGIITHAYLIAAMTLCMVEAVASHGRAARRALGQIVIRSLAVVALAWLVAIALWPWLQIGNPFTQFKIAYVHFATLDTQFEFNHWGERLSTTSLPWSYIPEQWLARLPVGFLFLLGSAVLIAAFDALRWVRLGIPGYGRHGPAGLHLPMLLLARSRNVLLVWIAAVLPVGYLMIRHATLYDGVRHTLFVIPML